MPRCNVRYPNTVSYTHLKNGLAALRNRKPADWLSGNGVKWIIFPFTPITTGSIFSKKKLSIRYFLILFQFLSLQSLSTSLHSKQQKLAQFARIAQFERISPLWNWTSMESALKSMILSPWSFFQNFSRRCVMRKDADPAYFAGIYIAVSYTHLDVYKRQSLQWILHIQWQNNIISSY